MAVEVPLTRGAVALIDEEDAERVLARKWRLIPSRNTAYAATGSTLYLHHLLLGKPPKGQEVDHRSGDGLDNRRENLRVVTHSRNLHNLNRAQRNSSLGIPNVRFAAGRYCATFQVSGKWVYVGRFDTVEDAAAAVAVARAEHGLSGDLLSEMLDRGEIVAREERQPAEVGS